MKKPIQTKAKAAAVKGVDVTVIGSFPRERSSVCADVLERLLNYHQLTSADTAADTGTARLAAVVSYLRRRYGWPILSTRVFAGCPDGRRERITEYTLPPGTVDRAMAVGAAAWCAGVRAARLALRAEAEKGYRRADFANAAFKTRETRDKNGLSSTAAP